MKNEKLPSLKNDLFSADELKSDDLKELVEVVGGAAPGTAKRDDCSDASDDQTGTNDSTKYKNDSTETGDTIRADDGCNEPAAMQVLAAHSNYVATGNDVVSGDLMAEDIGTYL